MKKILLTITLAGMLLFSVNGYSQGEDQVDAQANEEAAAPADAEEGSANEASSTPDDSASSDSTTADDAKADVDEAADDVKKVPAAKQDEEEEKGIAMVKRYFIEGGWGFMSIVLACLVFGLAFAIERLVVLTLKQINVKRFVTRIEGKLAKGDVNGAKEIARNTPGPIASIYYQGLDRSEEGIDIVEKSIVSYGSVQMGLLEKGLVWISLFISLAPMLGFMGTVIGMILAFDTIEAMGDIEPSAVAGGIKVALLTTVAGLIVAIILQIFYNLIVSMIDSMVNRMEDASITLVDMMIKYDIVKA